MFHGIRAEQEALGLDPWAPFADEEEWALVKWLISRVGQTAIDEFLKLPIAQHMRTSFTSKYTLMKSVDKLPHGTEWKLKRINVEGNLLRNGQCEREELELWLRNPVDCIRELMANAEFNGVVSYTPERVFADVEGKVRQFDEMWTGDWWWEMQGRLPEGATVAPVILASDKTSLSQFRGDQEVWPVYLTLGNISKDIRRQPSKHASILIAYLPISKLECFSRDTRSLERYRLFHYCMTQLLEPLVSAGKDGVDVICPDSRVRRMHPILAAYVADFPEQCLVSCCMENRCPKCVVGRNDRGDMRRSAPRERDSIMEYLRQHSQGELSIERFEGELGLQAIYKPFWATLPHNDIFLGMTPDILHQLHKGVFKDHLVNWCTDIIGEEALDTHFKLMTSYAGLHHFHKGISKRKQWTGADYRELQRVFLGVIAGAVENRVISAVRAVLDFIYYAQYQSHTENSLARMQAALASFHANKNVFIELEVREHFNIPKIHSMVHYIDSIRLFGSADGFNTELPECLHIDLAKRAYRASNCRDYVIQMTTWLRRQESLSIKDAYLHWWASQRLIDKPSDSAAALDLVEQDSDISKSDSDDDIPDHSRQLHIMPRQIHRFTMLSATRGYFVPKICSFPNIPIQRLIENHGTSQFVPALQAFVNEHFPGQLHRQLNAQDRVDVFKYLSVLSPARPHITNSKCFFKIRASPVVASRDPRKLPAPARFDTALFIENRELYTAKGISGLRVGEVKVVFNLPSRLGKFSHPLLYVHWFRPLQTFDDNLQTFRLARSSRQHGPHAAIVPATEVIRVCHVIPRFSRQHVVDEEQFYLNKYIDLDLFERLVL
ncbi:uncharacterized protein HD556DRAFT_1446500 [Suillus plorans]|uniref:Uncharacterized protein n=1 Tax=Suillus plorans TaxID=116603 RepID=A0A9P7AJZ2_9AGAM|nr:uncharacterized protein HD556DRAFT_1446500 [Suillus plorans]KAG1789923.1 hypothetical protein HD556DRAFT_1446500 [Suillus plorans]